jgi:Ca2+-binding RTX toxin-like protein
MAGGTGDDTYVVNSLLDTVTENAASGIDLVQSSVSFTLGDNVENLTLTGTSLANGTGNALNNVLIGNAAANILSGGLGNDTLTGMGGNDTMTGGAGADHFVWNTATGNGIDTITDYNNIGGTSAQGDVLEFHGLLTSTGTFTYLGAAAFTGSGSDHSEARVQGSQVLVDVNGDGTADIVFNLTGLHDASQLTAADFLWS